MISDSKSLPPRNSERIILQAQGACSNGILLVRPHRSGVSNPEWVLSCCTE